MPSSLLPLLIKTKTTKRMKHEKMAQQRKRHNKRKRRREATQSKTSQGRHEIKVEKSMDFFRLD